VIDEWVGKLGTPCLFSGSFLCYAYSASRALVIAEVERIKKKKRKRLSKDEEGEALETKRD